MTIYFSMPFYPVMQKTHFYNGHLAVSLDDTVYQIFNPAMLHCGFLVSEMPVMNWLYEESVRWVDRDESSQTYRHVNLYGKSETKRTAVYFIKVNDVSESDKRRYKNYFSSLEKKYQAGRMNFSFFKNNCASLLAPIFLHEGIADRNILNFLPAFLFKNIVRKCRSYRRDFETGRIMRMENDYQIHRFCFGLFRMFPQRYMDELVGKNMQEVIFSDLE